MLYICSVRNKQKQIIMTTAAITKTLKKVNNTMDILSKGKMNNTKEIVENNTLIAKFMGAVEKEYGMLAYPDTKLKCGKIISNNRYKKDLHYHSNWNWLMLVVEEIEGIVDPFNDNSINVTIGATNYCIIRDSLGEEPEFIGQGKTKIESVYIAVVNYIRWYYKNN